MSEDITYKMTVNFAEVRVYAVTGPKWVNRWKWCVSERTNVTEYYNKMREHTYSREVRSIDGQSRWRWRALLKAKSVMKKMQNGVERSTDVADLTNRISALEKELGIVTC